MEKSYRSSRGSASPNRLSPSPRSGNNTLQSRGRPSSAPNSSPTKSLRHATPVRRPSPPPNKPSTPPPRSSTPTPRRMSTGSSGPVVSSGVRGTSPVKSSRGNSASPKIRAWQTNIPGFSSEAPPNLRTSLADRPASYVRGSSPASRNGRDSTSKFSRQLTSPTASRSSSSFHSHDRSHFSSRSKGSVASSNDDDLDSIQSIPMSDLDPPGSRRGGSVSNIRAVPFSKKSTRTMSPNFAPKGSFDTSSLRQMVFYHIIILKWYLWSIIRWCTANLLASNKVCWLPKEIKNCWLPLRIVILVFWLFLALTNKVPLFPLFLFDVC